MANTNDDKGLFWNSENSDRLYDANSLGKWLSKFFTTGVMPGDFEVTVTNGLTVSMAAGYVNINNPNSANPGGKVRVFDSATSFTLSMASSLNDRIDTIVLERNDTDREITAKVVTGTPAEIPSPVAPVRNSSVYQLVIAEILVPVGATSLTAENITMKRADSSKCGIITGTVANNMILIGTQDLEEGVSELADGVVYFVYDE